MSMFFIVHMCGYTFNIHSVRILLRTQRIQNLTSSDLREKHRLWNAGLLGSFKKLNIRVS